MFNIYHKTGIFFFILVCVVGVFVFLNFDKIVAAPLLVKYFEEDSLTNGLVGYWTFDGENMISNVADSSGQGNHGYLTNFTSTTTVPGVIGQALSFDGADDYVDVGLMGNFGGNMATDKPSISYWVKTSDTAKQFIYGIRNSASDTRIDTRINVSSNGTETTGYIQAIISDEDGNQLIFGVDSDTGVSNGSWHHVVVKYDGPNNTGEIYVDGVSQTIVYNIQATPDNFANFIYNMYIGGFNNIGSLLLPFNGSLDEVRIYNRSLSQAEITDLYNQGAKKFITTNKSLANSPDLASGLVGYWTFDGPQMYDNVADSSGQGNHGSLAGQTSTTTVPGVIGQALSFDGADDYTLISSSVSGSSSLDMTGKSWTQSVWVKWDGTLYSRGIITFSDSASHTNGITNSNQANYGRFGAESYTGTGGTLYSACTTINPVAGIWYYVTGTWDGTNVRTYVNGSLCATSSSGSSDYDFSGDQLSIGGKRPNHNEELWGGNIDEVRIYNRSLSQAEITDLYNQGAKKFIKTNVSQAGSPNLASGLVGHWTFDGPQMYNNVADSSGQGNTGYLVGQTSTTTVPGVIGQALSFDGVDDYVDLGVPDPVENQAAVTISFWAKPSALSPAGGYLMYAKVNNNQVVYRMFVGTNKNFFWQVYNTSGLSSFKEVTDRFTNDTDWHHFVGVYDGAPHLYENGVLLGSGTTIDGNTRIGGATEVWWIGGTGSGGGQFNWNGLIDEVRIYNRALTEEEITELYNQGVR